MITIYYHCLDRPDDERFFADALGELAENLKAEPITLSVVVKRLDDDPDLVTKVTKELGRLNDQSYTYVHCSAQIGYLLVASLPRIDSSVPRLLVYCSQQSDVAQSALRANPAALWGATCGCSFGCVYQADNNKYIIWHEALHLLGVDDCYVANNPHRKKPDCDCAACIMQYAPTRGTVGPWPSLCEKNIKQLRELANKAEELRRGKEGS